jgi:DNA polymerase-3 subunit delta
MTYNEILNDLKNKIYKPIYLLFGDEAFFIDKISNFIAENVLNENEKDFNQTVFYGKDTLTDDIINAAKRYPMMANHQVIIVKEAQELKNIEKLEFYVEKPLNSTILVINYKYKSFDKRKKLYKLLEKNAVLYESKKLYENQVPEWITNYLKEKKYSISPISCKLLVEFLGSDLTKIANELEKLMISLPAATVISPDDIEKNIGFSKDYNNFELQNALRDRDILKANRIVLHFAANPKNNPITVTIISLFVYFSKILSYHFLKDKSKANAASVLKINPFFLPDYVKASQVYSIRKAVSVISILREYDMKEKGVNNPGISDEDLLKELIYKIMH